MKIKPREDATYDIVALGEVMLRLDPGEDRIANARTFRAWEGGGEYNVARGLTHCFGLRSAVVTALADNDVGRLVEGLMRAGGVDTRHVRWAPYDGIGRRVRNGLNFTERGFGVRAAKGVSDRANTAAAQLRADDVDWPALFAGARWLHSGGIFAALSDVAAETAERAVACARACGTVVSYDLNYRPSLWRDHGGLDRARAVNRAIVPLVDVLLGNEEDFADCLGCERAAPTADGGLDVASYKRMIGEVADAYPNLAVIATTLRKVRSASRNDWGAVAWSRETGFAEATPRPDLEIYDRVGGGDSFASGLIYGLMELGDLSQAVEYGAAHGALAMTTPGDTSQATLAEVRRMVAGRDPRVDR
ncbi:MAG: sugar kinase [Bifidobacteriaceae bacterium]|nr:sugar kinase [Bifidobacteriaceae bacterium]